MKSKEGPKAGKKQQRIRPRTLVKEQYEYPPDRMALQALSTLKPVEYLCRFFIRQFAEPWLQSQLFGRAVKVSAKQMPHINELALEAASFLHLEDHPEVFVIQNPYLNAYTIGVNDRNIIVLHHSLLDSCSTEEIRFIIAHEMGHIKSEHVLYHTLSRWISGGVSIFLRWAILPAQTALFTWQRKSEITADRAGLIVAQNIDVACRALIKLALGSPTMAASINIPEFVRDQLFELSQSPLRSWPEMFQTHPYIPKRLGHIISFAESAEYQRILTA